MKPETNADYGEQVRDDVLAAVQQALADGGAGPTIAQLARVIPHEPEDIETALQILADVGDVELGRDGRGVLRVARGRQAD